MDFYQARDLLVELGRYYREERSHLALQYPCPMDCYRVRPEALLAERKRKLKATCIWREVN